MPAGSTAVMRPVLLSCHSARFFAHVGTLSRQRELGKDLALPLGSTRSCPHGGFP